MEKNIYHVITTISRGGAEKQLLTIAKSQVLRGDKINVIYLKAEPDLLLEFQKSGVNVNQFLVGKSFLKQIKLFSEFSFQENAVIHAHLPRAELLCYLSQLKISYIVTRHNSELFFPKAPKKFSNFLSKRVIRKAKQVIAISFAVEKFIQENGEIDSIDLEKISVIYYGVSRKYKDVYIPKMQKPKNLVLGTAARLTEQKDIPTLLRGFKVVLSTYPEARLLIAGEGYLKAKLIKLTSELEINGKVDWLGVVPDMDEFYSKIDCFILTSKYEGFGLVLLEAMEFGLPIVATRTTSIPEVLGEKGGLLFEIGNPYDLAKCVRDVIGTQFHPKIQLDHNSALAKFSIEKAINKYDDIYNLVVGKK